MLRVLQVFGLNFSMELLTAAGIFVCAVCLLVSGIVYSPRPLPFPGGVKKRNVLLVIAHPDDESMFFGPTLLSLATLRIYNVRILSISSGNSEGKGSLRKKEMLAACSVFNIPSGNVDVLDLPDLQDGFKCHWDRSSVARLVKQRILDHSMNTLITFDDYGISGHPNHQAVHHAIRALLRDSDQDLVEAWELVSCTLFRKFIGPMDILVSFLESCLTSPVKQQWYYSRDPWTNARAMRQHKSQWLWYRKLFVIFSRYTYVNALKRIPRSSASTP